MSQQATEMFRMSCGATAPLELKISGPGWASGELRVFEVPFVFVGRDERSCLRLEDGGISRRHAYLQQFGQRVFCVDLGSRTGIRWAEERRSAGWLDPEQGVQIGPFTLGLGRTAQAGENRGAKSAEPWDPLQDRANDSRFLPRLTVESGNEVLTRCCLNRMLVLVGSAPECRVRLRGVGVSHYHCSLLRTPQGVWLIDLLSGNGTYLNGESLRWTLVKEGDQLQVGPYALRVWYPEVDTESPPGNRVPVEIPTVMPVQAVEDMPEPGQPPSQSEEALEPAGTAVSMGAPVLQAERDGIGEVQRDAEFLRQHLSDSQAECDRLRERAGTLEAQLAEVAGLQARLEAAEASVGELVVVRRERDQRQAEVQNLQDGLASDSVEREELRQQLEELQQRLDKEREAVRAAEARLETESANLQKIREEFVAQNAEHDAILQRMQDTRDELARSQDEARSLQMRLEQTLDGHKEVESLTQQLADARAEHAQLYGRLSELESHANATAHFEARLRATVTEMEQIQVRLRDAESRGTELESVRAECDRHREQTRALEAQLAEEAALLQARLEAAEAGVGKFESVLAECDRFREQARALEAELAEVAGLQARLEAAEASAAQLAVVHRERDQWQAEVQKLQDRLASETTDEEELRRLVGEVNAAKEERDRLQTEEQMARQSAEQAWARVSELERAEREAAAAHEAALQEARARCESERQALETPLSSEGQTRPGSVEDAVRDVQVQAAAEREQWRQLLQGAESQLLWERGMFQEQSEQFRRQAAGLQAERDRFAGQLAEAESRRNAKQERSTDQASHEAEREPMRPQAAPAQPLVQPTGIHPGHLPAQPPRPQYPDAPTTQRFPQAVLMRERGTAEEQRRLNAIAQEIQAAWGEAPGIEERLPVIAIPLDRPEERLLEGSLATDQENAIAHSSAPPAPPTVPVVVAEESAASDTPHGSPASGVTQSGDDPHTSLPSRKHSRPEGRSWLWRQILGYVRGK